MSRIVYNKYVPFGKFLAINIFGVIFVKGRPGVLTSRVIRHERIHTAQMRELGYLPFYLLYGLEWLVRLPVAGPMGAYRKLSFEREAYDHEGDAGYPASRRRWAMWRSRRRGG